MIVLRDPSEADSVPAPYLRALVLQRMTELFDDDEPPLATIYVLERPTDLHELRTLLGFSILHNRSDGTAYGDPPFFPSFELIEEHANCFEMVFVLSDDGAGALVFIPKDIDVDPQLLAMCRQYAVRSQETAP
jgi:hypothetical protein